MLFYAPRYEESTRTELVVIIHSLFNVPTAPTAGAMCRNSYVYMLRLYMTGQICIAMLINQTAVMLQKVNKRIGVL